jgi:peptidyl-prolyl cis-trans isomerase B (cyclophilin B)
LACTFSAVPSADKRQRKKENTRMARAAREAAVRRRKRIRAVRNFTIAAAVFALGIVLINVFTGDDNKKKTTPTTVATTTPTTVALPAGCVKTVPKPGTKPTDLKAPAMAIDANKTYTAKLSTTCGDVTIALDAKNAPKSVNNFVSLARKGFFDGLKWHRVATDPPVVQGGDPSGNGTSGPGYNTVVELPTDGKYPPGAVAWAKGPNDPDGSAGSQFFVDSGDASGIGAHYGYIGKVSGGFPNVTKMATLAVPGSQSGAPAHPLYILKVTISES